MRQVGVLCAAALVAVQENVSKLEEDHANARVLAEGLNHIKGLKVDLASVETNIIYVDLLEDSHSASDKISKKLKEQGILLMPESSTRIRLVLHHQVSASDVQYTISCFKSAVTGTSQENGF